jgi:uncharacterized protein YceK
MRKILMFTMACMLLLSGCKSAVREPQPVKKVYTAETEIGDGGQLEEKWTIEGLDNDYLTKTTMIYTYSFDDLAAWGDYLTELMGVLDQRIEELQGAQGSRYIIMEYAMDGNLLVVTEITDYEAASKNNEAVMMNDVIELGEYYSMSKLCDNFDPQKYTLQE